MFNFSKDNFSEGSNVVIFNNGDGGKVNNVTIEIQKKGVDYEDAVGNKPAYQIVYTDADGGKTNDGVFYLVEATFNPQYSTFEEAVQKQWNRLAAIVIAAGGDPSITAKTPVEMVDQMAVLIKNATKGKSFNVLANYGVKSNPKKYIQIRSWSPFIESADTPESESKLKPGKNDQLEKIELPDAVSSAPSTNDWI
jgi:hypothetical protein